MLIVIIVLLGLGAGTALGWFFGSRPVVEWRERFATLERDLKDLDAKYLRAFADLEGAKERLKMFDHETEGFDAVRAHRDSLNSEVAKLNANAANFDEQKLLLLQSQELMKKEFEASGAKVLESAQETFLKRAQDRFNESEQLNAERIRNLLAPVNQSLNNYKEQVEKLEKERVDGFGNLTGLIEAVRDGQQRVLDGANHIATTLRGATKARGDWGELQLVNLLESCGLSERADFDFQSSVTGSDGLLRPDAVINIPGGRRLVVDIKNVFNTYARANEAATDEERQVLLKTHAREIRTHIDELADKRYQDHVEGSADFVIMFVPGEHVLYTALSQESGLLEYALKRQVVLTSPLNFMSIALTIATIWRQSGMQADAKEIAALGKELYDRLAKMGTLLDKVGSDLARTNRSFNSAVSSFESRLVPTGRRFEQLSVDTAAEFESLSPIEIEPRQVVHVEPANDEAAK